METVISVRCNKRQRKYFRPWVQLHNFLAQSRFHLKQGHRKFLTWHWREFSRVLLLHLRCPWFIPWMLLCQRQLAFVCDLKKRHCMFNNAIIIFRPCGFSTYTMLYLWSPWFVCHIEQEHRYAWHCCCSSEQRRYAGSYCLLQLSCTSTVTLYVHLMNVTTLCSSHLVQWGTLTVIHLSHACGIPSLTSSLCHTRLCSVIPLLRPMWCITTLC